MYGMIHVAIQKMTVERLGPAAWDEILRQTGFSRAEFISASVYDDSVTLGLIDACAAACEYDVNQFLEEMGVYWIGFASKGAYSSLMKLSGADLGTFLHNLDRLHQSVQSAMPAARLPSFTVQEAREGYVRVTYASDRAGLESFVTGLFKGLLTLFNHEGDVWVAGRSNSGVDFDIQY